MPSLPLRSLLLLLALFLLTLGSCYEDRVGCLDPAATNYDLRADEGCGDCCTFPSLRLSLDRVYGENAFSLADTLTDGAGNRFRVLRARFYVGDVELLAGATFEPVPQNFVEVGVRENGDTVLTELNLNLALLSATGSATRTIGNVRPGGSALTDLSLTLGLPPTFADVVPTSAPASSPLSVQPGLLNFNDGNGYLRGSYEYILTDTDDTLRVDLTGFEPLTLPFPAPVIPVPGTDITVDLEIDYAELFGALDLARPAADQVSLAAERLPATLRVTDVR